MAGDDPLMAIQVAARKRKLRIQALSNFEQAQRDVDQFGDNYLKHWGWSQTCDTPGSLWLWRRDFVDEDVMEVKNHKRFLDRVKEYKGSAKPLKTGVMVVSRETALAVTQRYLESMHNVE